MLFTVYKTTNKINGKYYIGTHKTKNPNDNYLGSGVALKRAIQKYGEENFIKEVLFVFDNPDAMYAKEKEIVEIGEHTYNLMEGGKGGFDHIDNFGDNNPMRNPQVVKKMINTSNAKGSYHTNKKVKSYLSNIKKATKSNIGKKRPDHSTFMKTHAKKMWDENKDKMRDSLSSCFTVVSPNGIIYNTNRLQDFCIKNDLPYTTLWKTSVTGKTPNRGKAKGWICIKDTNE